MNWGTFLTQCHLNLHDFPTNYRSSFSIPLRLLLIKSFSSVTWKTLAFSYSKMYRELMKWHAWLVPLQAYMGLVWTIISKNISPKQAEWPIFFIIGIKMHIGKEHLRQVQEKISNNFFFWRITLNRETLHSMSLHYTVYSTLASFLGKY